MTATRQSPVPPSPADLELREALEKTGLRFTRQRAAVYRFLRSNHGHPTVEEVHAAVHRELPKISLATVYKALDALVESGLVEKINNRDGPCRFDCQREPHYHFHCQDSQRIIDLPIPYDPHLLENLAPELLDTLRRQGYQVTGYRLEFVGITRNS